MLNAGLLFLFSCIHVLFSSEILLPSDKTALIIDDRSILQSHRLLVDHLERLFPGTLDIVDTKNKTFGLIEFSRMAFRNVVMLLTKTTKFGKNMPVSSVLEYLDFGGNLLLAVGPDASGDVDSLINGLGFEVASHKSSQVIDHGSYDASWSKSHTRVIVNPRYLANSKALFSTLPGPVVYEGRGFALDPTNVMTFKILSASPTSYLSNPDSPLKEFPLAVGEDIALIGGVQMRNKGRAVVIGSLSFLSDRDAFVDVAPEGCPETNGTAKSGSGNIVVSESIVNWVFQKTGVVRLRDPTHKLVSTGSTLDEYVVETLLEYSVVLERMDEGGNWVPYVVDDLQLELIRLTLFSRVAFKHTTGGVYVAQFYTPDFIGTYRLETRHRRLGYTVIDHHVKIIVRPRKHNDYERFLPGAYPYYATAFLMLGLAFSLVFVLINLKEVKTSKID